MSNQCPKNFINPRKQRQLSSLAAERARRDIVVAGQVCQCVEIRLCFAHALLEDFNAGFRSDTDVAVIEIYAAGRFS